MKTTEPGQFCRTCQQRMDAVVWSAGRHPGCGVAPPISDRAEASLIAALALHLGAAEIRSANREDTLR